jgi:hypothetical protein
MITTQIGRKSTKTMSRYIIKCKITLECTVILRSVKHWEGD